MSYIVLNWTNPATVKGKPGKKSSIVLNAYSIFAPGGGAVNSVNGQQGDVVLTAPEVGADEAGAAETVRANLQAQIDELPTQTDLENALIPYANNADVASGDAASVLAAQTYTDNTTTALATSITTQLAGKADLVDGVLATSQIPAQALTVFLGAVTSQAQMLALVGQSGDWCIRSDQGMTYVISSAVNTGLLSDWTALPQPASPVVSVNGQSGVIVLSYANVGADAAGSAAAVQSSLQGQINTKADANSTLTVLASKVDKTTQVIAGTGLTGGGALSADRTLSLADSGVTAATYGSATQVAQVTIDIKGRVTSATSVTITPAWSSITGKPTTLSGYGITDAVSSGDVVVSPTANKLLKLDANGKLPADITGNAATATKLATPRTITLTGAVTGSANFDGSGDVSIATTSSPITWANVTKIPAALAFGFASDNSSPFQVGKDGDGNVYIRGVIRNTGGATISGFNDTITIPTSHKFRAFPTATHSILPSAGGYYFDRDSATTVNGSIFLTVRSNSTTNWLGLSAVMAANSTLIFPLQCIGMLE